MPHGVPDEVYDRIAETIASDDSPVGIDAKVTHILILHKLAEIEERLERLESRGEGAAGERGRRS